MFSLYNSVCRLIAPTTQTLNPSYSQSSFDFNTKVEKIQYMDTSWSTYDRMLATNDTGEVIVLEYNKHDKTFVQYRPKFKR